MVKRVINYLNPIAHLGDKRYPYWLAILLPLLTIAGLEFYAYNIAHDPLSIGLAAVFIFILYVIYFSFRAGVLGGLFNVLITICYYLYIIYSRHYSGTQLSSGIDTTVILGTVYFFLALIIGWLKQTVDGLIEGEANEKKRLQTIVQQLPVGIIITDAEGRVVQANKRLEDIIGTKLPTGFLIGRDEFAIKNSVGDKEVPPSHSPVFQAIMSGKQITRKEFIVERKDKKKVHVTVNASPILNRAGKVIAAASIITDVTAQREVEKRKDDFVNMASHELKTPITSMKLYIDSLMLRIKKGDDEKAVKTLKSIKNQTERLQELVNDLLDVSRLQTGKLTFTKERFRIDTLINETVSELQGAASERLIAYKSPSITVLADRFRIYQVITNLITNAMKYSDGDIVIRVKRTSEDVVVSVQDSGIGIDKDQQNKIFERLYQVADDTEKTFPGFGMGLYISKEIVKRHHGKIWVESEKGKGSTFFFTLPIEKR